MDEFLLIVISYVLGNVLTGFILSKFIYRKDLRVEGSGNIGARNAGRMFGKRAFLITFIGDALKGAFTIFMATATGFDEPWQLVALLSCIVGHMYPIVLRFRGGKGISTFAGGMLAFEPLLFLYLILICLIVYVLLRSFTWAGLIAIGLAPFVMYLLGFSTQASLVSSVISGIIIVAHRTNIIQKFRS